MTKTPREILLIAALEIANNRRMTMFGESPVEHFETKEKEIIDYALNELAKCFDEEWVNETLLQLYKIFPNSTGASWLKSKINKRLKGE